MTYPIKTSNSSVSPGDIQFLSAVHPPLASGSYTLTGSQQINNLEQGNVAPYTASQNFFVTAPQFTIDPSSIHSVYPPKGQTGNYYKQMPFMVFNNFALPWARTLTPGSAQTDTSPPWMTILLAYESDKQGESPNIGGYDSATGKWVGPTTVSAEDVIAAKTNVVTPAISDSDIKNGPNTSAQIIEMKYQFFLDIAPTLEELPLLSHARDVNTDNKIMLGMDVDGLFSVVVSNRVPPAEGGKCTAFLISLEGHQDHLPSYTLPKSASADQSIRVVVLGGWEFTASKMPGSFRQLMIDVETKGGVKLLQAPGDPNDAVNEIAKEAMEIGYVALKNELRIGEKSTSWYRGPCVPAPTKQVTDYAPYHYSDHAIQYDPETGIFDLSYAAAWQVGRLLALSDGAFSQSLSSWRRTYLGKMQSNAEQESVESKVIPALTAVSGNSEYNAASNKVVPQLHSFMHCVAHPDTSIFPKINVRKPIKATVTLKTDNANESVNKESSDPLVTLAKQQNADRD
jgi:hypothetical protein